MKTVLLSGGHNLIWQAKRVLALVRSADDSSEARKLFCKRAHGFLPKEGLGISGRQVAYKILLVQHVPAERIDHALQLELIHRAHSTELGWSGIQCL